MGEKIYLEDAERFLDEEELEELKMLREEIELLRGFGPLPEDRRRYWELRDKVVRGKQSESEFEEYEGEVEKDVSALQKLRRKYYEKTAESEEEAVDFISSELRIEPTSQKLNTSEWAPQVAGEIRNAAKEMVECWWISLSEKIDHPEAFRYEAEAWPFPIPKIGFRKIKDMPALVWKLKAYAVATLRVWKAETEKAFKGWIWTSSPSKSPIAVFTQLLTPSLFEIEPEETITPWTLLSGLMSWEFQPEGCEIVEKSEKTLAYKCEGYREEISLTLSFIDFLRRFGKEGKDPREALHEHGFIDDLTVEILEECSSFPPSEVSKVRKKDFEYLKTISECKDRYFSYKEWGERLGLERSGALKATRRLSEDGLVERDKHESGEGVKMSLTGKGKATLEKYS